MLAYVLIAFFLTQPAQDRPEPAALVPALEETDLCAWAERMALEPPCRRPEDCRAFQEWRQHFGDPGSMQARPPAPQVVPLGPMRVPDGPRDPQRARATGATCLAGR